MQVLVLRIVHQLTLLHIDLRVEVGVRVEHQEEEHKLQNEVHRE